MENGYKSTHAGNIIAKTFFVINRNSTSEIFVKALKCCVLCKGHALNFLLERHLIVNLTVYFLLRDNSRLHINENNVGNMRKNLTLKGIRTKARVMIFDVRNFSVVLLRKHQS